MACLSLCDEVGQCQVGVGTGYEVGMMVLQQVFLHALGHAAQNADDQVALSLDGIERFETA